MRQVSLAELRDVALASKDSLWDAARSVGRDVKIYLHWTAAGYNATFDDYHINIDGDGNIFLSTDDLSEVISHTYHRNTGAVGISLCCALDATTNDLGPCPPTAAQIETMAKVGCVLADAFDLTIDKDRVMTHGEAADNEDGLEPHEEYGPKTTCERWDLEVLGTEESPSFNPWDTEGHRGGDILRGKMNWYRNSGIAELQ